MDKNMLAFYKAALEGSLSAPLCADYKTEWRKCGDDKERLMMLAMRMQSIPYVVTHARSGFGLTKSYILDTFKDYVNGKVLHDCDGVEGYTYQLFVDAPIDVNVSSDVNSFMWCKDTDVLVEQTKCSRLYVSNDSVLNVTCDGYNSIVIYLFDDSIVNLVDIPEDSDVTVYKYSGRAQVNTGKYCLGRVKIFNKELRL